MHFLKENKQKLVRFIFAWFVVIFITTGITTLNLAFFDCRYGTCFVSVCVDDMPRCNSDENDCCIYETKEIPFRDHLIAKLKLNSLLVGAGLGLFIAGFYADMGNKKTKYVKLS